MNQPQIPLMDLDREIVLANLHVQGAFPDWLKGTLVRNGPAKFHYPHGNIDHWFDGMAMLHSFSFGNGRVSYRNKFLHSSPYLQAQKYGTTCFEGFMQDPCCSIFRRFFTQYFPYFLSPSMLNTNVNVAKVANEFVALTETPLPIRFDLETLETLGPLIYADSLRKRNTFESAHPLHDPIKKETVNYFVDYGHKSRYQLYRIKDGHATRDIFTSLEVQLPSYMHTFSITERFFILVEYPLRVNPRDFLIKGGGFISNFRWNQEEPTIFHIVERGSGKVINRYEYPAFFSFHHVNAFEEKENVILDLISYPDDAIVYGAPPKEQQRKLQRFTLSLNDGEITAETIAETNLELPRIYYEKSHALPYQYVYGVDFPNHVDNYSHIGLLKIDVQTGEKISWHRDKCLAGEPVYISHPGSSREQDGVILSLVLNNQKKNSFLLALDFDFNEIASAEVPLEIPYGLHGMFVSS